MEKSGKSVRQKKVILSARTIIFTLLLIVTVVQYINNPEVKIPIVDWKSKYINYNEGWYIDETIAQTSESIDMIYGPYVEIKKGIYKIKVDYECEEDQGCLVYANSGNDAYIKTQLKTLPKDQRSLTYYFTLTKDIDNFEAVIKYDGNGYLKIRDINIRRYAFGWNRIFILVLLLFFSVNAEVYRIILNRKTIVFIMGLFALIFLAGEILDGQEKTSWVEMLDVHQFPDLYDVCFLGSSTAQTNNSNQELYEKYGIAGISLGDSMQPIYIARYTLEEMLHYQSPKVIFYDTASLFYSREQMTDWTRQRENFLLYDFLGGLNVLPVKISAFEAMRNYDSQIDIEKYIEKLGNVHVNWKNIINPDFYKRKNPQRIHGNIEQMGIYEALEYRYNTCSTEDTVEIEKEAEQYLSEMIAICKKANVDFILITTRVDSTKGRHKMVAELAAKYGAKYIDINEYIEELGFQFDKDLYDNIHYNLSGAIKSTDFLGEYLINNYEITDKRGDAAYIRYEQQREDFEVKKEIILQPSFREYLTELTELDQREYIIFVSVYGVDAHRNLGDYDVELLKKLGFNTELMRQSGYSYAAIMYDSVVQEEFSTEDIAMLEGNIDGLSYKIMSDGALDGKNAVIELNGVDYIQKGTGFNFVVYNRLTEQIEDSVYFNTYAYKNPFGIGIFTR